MSSSYNLIALIRAAASAAVTTLAFSRASAVNAPLSAHWVSYARATAVITAVRQGDFGCECSHLLPWRMTCANARSSHPSVHPSYRWVTNAIWPHEVSGHFRVTAPTSAPS